MENKKALVIGNTMYRGVNCKVVATVHADIRMTEREVRRLETILDAVNVTDWDDMSRTDYCMVHVVGQPLSFILGFNRQDVVSVVTVINKPNANPNPGTYVRKVTLEG